MDIHAIQKRALSPLVFIEFLKSSKYNYQLDQVLENFKYLTYFDGIILIKASYARFTSDRAVMARWKRFNTYSSIRTQVYSLLENENEARKPQRSRNASQV